MLEEGRLTLRLEHSFVPMSTSHVAECPDLGPECEGPVEPTPFNHHIDQFIFETSVTAGLAVTSWLELETRWTLRVVDVNPTYSELDGTPKVLNDDIHHHDETVVDATDPWLLARLAHKNGDFVGSMQLGMTFPIGRTEEDPYRLGREGRVHQHLQAGSGTVMPVVGVGLAYDIAPVTIGLSGIAFVSAYENDEGFRAPSRLYASHRVSVSLLKDVLRPFVGVDLAHETEEYWQGEPGLEGSNVRTELYGSAGLAYRFLDPWTVDLSLRGRLAKLTHAATFDVPIMVGLGITTSFDIWSAHAAEPVVEQRVEDGATVFEKKAP